MGVGTLFILPSSPATHTNILIQTSNPQAPQYDTHSANRHPQTNALRPPRRSRRGVASFCLSGTLDEICRLNSYFIGGLYYGIHFYLVSTRRSKIIQLLKTGSSATRHHPLQTATQHAATGEQGSWQKPRRSIGVSTSSNRLNLGNCRK